MKTIAQALAYGGSKLGAEAWDAYIDNDILALAPDCAVGKDCMAVIQAAEPLILLAADRAADIKLAVAEQCSIFLHG